MRTNRGRLKRIVAAAAISAMFAFAPTAHAMETTCDVEYVGGAERFAQVESDMFEHVSEVMPGDVIEATIVVTNSQQTPIEVFAYADNIVSGGPTDTLERLTLNVSAHDGRTIYSGPLAGAEAAEAVSLGEYAQGESASITYAIEFPFDLANEYARTAVESDLVIGVEERPVEAGSTYIAENETPLGSATIGKTGDHGLLIALVGAAAIALFVIGTVVVGAMIVLDLAKDWCHDRSDRSVE